MAKGLRDSRTHGHLLDCTCSFQYRARVAGSPWRREGAGPLLQRRSEMSADGRGIRSERHITVGSVIERDANTILERWVARAIEEQPNAKRLHHDALVDQLGSFLRALAHSLAGSYTEGLGNHNGVAKEHGLQRWEVGWSLAEVVKDYQLLRLVLIEH